VFDAGERSMSSVDSVERGEMVEKKLDTLIKRRDTERQCLQRGEAIADA
jgi:hypothetical protein